MVKVSKKQSLPLEQNILADENENKNKIEIFQKKQTSTSFMTPSLMLNNHPTSRKSTNQFQMLRNVKSGDVSHEVSSDGKSGEDIKV